jgi:hypothetical protein
MDLANPAWQELVTRYTSSLDALRDAASVLTGLSGAALLEPETATYVDVADAHLEASRGMEAYLFPRLEHDSEARLMLGKVASIDFHAAALLDQASEEPEPEAIQAAEAIAGELDPQSVKAELVLRPLAGAGATSPLVDVEKSCEEVLADAAEQGKALAEELAKAVTPSQILDGFAQVIGGTAVEAIERFGEELSAVKKKVLDFIQRGVEKLGKLLGLDAVKIKDELQRLWENARQKVGDWAADLLGRSDVLDRWRDWLNDQPPPAQSRVVSALGKVGHSTDVHRQHVRWAGKGVWAFGKLAKWGAALSPVGAPVVVAVAGALGGWVTWIAWDHLNDVEAAVA